MEEVAAMNIDGRVCFSFIGGAAEDSGICWVITFSSPSDVPLLLGSAGIWGESDGIGFAFLFIEHWRADSCDAFRCILAWD